MALETNTPQLTLEHMSLGSQERLEAGIREGITSNLTSGFQNYTLCLFSGRRPSPEEIKNGIYFLQGVNSEPSTQFCGIYRISPNQYMELSTESPFALNGRVGNSDEVLGTKLRPANMANFTDTDGYVVRHHLFKKHVTISCYGNNTGVTITDEVKQLGNGAAPTWALMYPWGHYTSWTNFLYHNPTSARSQTHKRRDGKILYLSPKAVQGHTNFYLTVGDINDEPTANLVLRKGAEAGQVSQPKEIVIHRLKFAMPKTKTAPLTLAGDV